MNKFSYSKAKSVSSVEFNVRLGELSDKEPSKSMVGKRSLNSQCLHRGPDSRGRIGQRLVMDGNIP